MKILCWPKTYLSLLLIATSYFAFAQDVEIEEEVVMEEEDHYPPADDSYNQNNKRRGFKRQALVDNFTLIYRSNGTSSYNKVYGLLEDEKEILPIIFSYSYSSQNKASLILGLSGKWGIYNFRQKAWEVPIIYTSIASLGKNLYKAGIGNQFGIIDAYNNVLVDFKWSQINSIGNLENYYIVRSANTAQPNFGIYSVLAKKLTVEPKYKSISKIATDDIFKVQNDLKLHNIIDVKGNLKFKKWYDNITPEAGGKPRYIVSLDGKFGVVDSDEKIIVPITYKSISLRAYSDGSYLAQNQKGKFGFITIDGDVTLPFVYDNLTFQSYNGIGISSTNKKCGIVKVNNGKPYELATCEYDDITIQNNVFIIEQNKKFGLMDLYGKLNTEIRFDELAIIDTKLYKAKQKGKYFLINAKGEQVSEKSFEDISPVYTATPTYSGYNYNKRYTYLKTKSGEKFGLIDKVGVEVLEPIFDNILNEANNLIVVQKGEKLGLYNLYDKNFTVPAEYDQLIFSGRNYHGFKGQDIYKITPGASIQITKIN